MTDDPLKHTPACELDRDNRVMTREDEGVRAVMESLRAENERLKATHQQLQEDSWQLEQKLRVEIKRLRAALGPSATEAWRHMYAENERLKAIIGYLEDHADIPISIRLDARRAVEPKP